jgi:Tfp pilus assembly PilM family ATPase
MLHRQEVHFQRGRDTACNRALEGIAQEVRRSLNYFSRQRRGGQIQADFRTGATVPANLDSYLEEQIGVPVVVDDVFVLLARDPRFSEQIVEKARQALPGSARASLATAAGLALRDMS